MAADAVRHGHVVVAEIAVAEPVPTVEVDELPMAEGGVGRHW
jgi:hypothetical protein